MDETNHSIPIEMSYNTFWFCLFFHIQITSFHEHFGKMGGVWTIQICNSKLFLTSLTKKIFEKIKSLCVVDFGPKMYKRSIKI